MFDALIQDPYAFFSFVAALVCTGVCAGFLAGLLGVGGGIVIVPVLFLLFPFLGVEDSVVMHLAVGTSLATIIPTSIISARSHYKKGGVDVDLLKSWAPAIFVGVIIGGFIGGKLQGTALTLTFAIVAILVAANMAFRKKDFSLSDSLPTGVIRSALGSFIGGFSVLMGIGGGTLSVPILTLFNYPIRRAVGTASAIGLCISVPGSISFILSGLGDPNLPQGSFGYLNILGFACIVPATMLLAPVGAKFAHTIDPSKLRMAFALFLSLTSLRMFYVVLIG